MKAVLDENLPTALARSLNALFAGEHEIIHLRDRFGSGVSNVDRIRTLSTEGRWSVISGDRRITRNKVEAAAFLSSRLIGFFLSKGLYKAPILKQMKRLCALSQTIEAQQALVSSRVVCPCPFRADVLKNSRWAAPTRSAGPKDVRRGLIA